MAEVQGGMSLYNNSCIQLQVPVSQCHLRLLFPYNYNLIVLVLMYLLFNSVH